LVPVIVPFFGDQRFWASRLRELGTSPPPVPRAELSSERLATALHSALTNKTMTEAVQTLGAQIASEQGAAQAARLIAETHY
jgi:UDP:flavonoid glycosyltransferase YjiC (YdhE family)